VKSVRATAARDFGLRPNRPPDHGGEIQHRELEDDEHEDRFPGGHRHDAASLDARAARDGGWF
jgi:hypothetical protein